MIEPEKEDIGRKVMYIPSHAKGNPELWESGVITSFNSSFVFVRYSSDVQSKATRREDLVWEK